MLQKGFEHERLTEESSSQVFHITKNLQTPSSPKHEILQSSEVSWVINTLLFLGQIKTTNHPLLALPYPPSLALILSLLQLWLHCQWGDPFQGFPDLVWSFQKWAVTPSFQMTLPRHPSAITEITTWPLNYLVTPSDTCPHPFTHSSPTLNSVLNLHIWHPEHFTAHIFFRTRQDINK